MNLRSGPSTDHEVVSTIQRGNALVVGPADDRGWARVYDGGPAGSWVWRASSLLLYTRPDEQPRAGLGVPIATCKDGSWAYAPRTDTTCKDRGGIFKWWPERDHR